MGRQSKKEKAQVAKYADWFYDTFMKNEHGLVSIDDFSRKFTEIKYKRPLSTEQYLAELKEKAKTDGAAFDQLVAYAKHGYLSKINSKLVMPVRYFYEHEKDEQGNPVRLIYSVKRNGKRAWTFINLKDEDFWNQTAIKNLNMTDAYTENEKRMFEQAWNQLKLAKNEKEKERAMNAMNLFLKRGRRYEVQ